MSERSPSSVTQLLVAAAKGDRGAAEAVIPVVYEELRRLATAQLAQERPGQTLQPTALVHEAYIRLVGGKEGMQFEGRAHFFGAASRAMRQVLVDRARRAGSQKRGGDRRRVSMIDATAIMADPTPAPDAALGRDVELVDLNEALSELESESPRTAEVVLLRYFGGLGVEETGAVLGISAATVKSDWAFAKAWLRRRLIEGMEPQ